MRPLVILDRDGVLNEDSDAFIKSPQEWIPIAGAAAAVARLNQAGFDVYVATNQSGIARGYYSLDTLSDIHKKMCAIAADAGAHFDGITFCPHGPDAQCGCRKPLPGLLDQIAVLRGAPVAGGWMVGDTLRDLQAGVARGCRPALVRTGKGQRTLDKGLPAEFADTPVFDDLPAFVDWLLRDAAGTSV
ncbi:D-glycero-beta-D-manno-heptose 1,7-bisphosphate 7-phosphatase [Isoalcanivorax beigongshangi]|uniref:D,D-heptose 1,7-bisphosphate phosphatase n=1 Tax=Isoalcanivorax beigongshangi TaxID=3238810 RepID=A0ABV4ACP6_9GAMM